MKLNILGSGGVMPMPRPTCFCDICKEAREKWIPYSRTWCSMFLYDVNLLFDTPEEIRLQLNRERIEKVEHVILTHRHPDHTLWLRIFEQLNWNFSEWKTFNKPIKVYISNWQKDMLKKMSCWWFLDFYKSKWMIELIELEHKKNIIIDNIIITPYLIEHNNWFYFLLNDGNKKLVYAMCEYHNLIVYPEINNIDLLIAHNLFWENSDISPRKTKPKDEDSFEKMLEDTKKMWTKNIYLNHIEETFKLSHDELWIKMKKYYPGFNIAPTYDWMIIEF